MKLVKFTVKNFRGYKEETSITFNDLTAFVGANDIGKSTILEAMDIFFNEGKGIINMDKNDVNKKSVQEGDDEIVMKAEFDDLPDKIIVDVSIETSLKDEYLLNAEDKLCIIKKYPNGGKAKVFLLSYYPNNSECKDLILKKQKDLQKIIDDNSILCRNYKENSTMRKAIFEYYKESIQCSEQELEISGDDLKNIWSKIQKYIPLYSLFQSDRSNTDKDKEVQDPIKNAVNQILSEETIQKQLDNIANTVTDALKKVTDKTLEKIREMNPELAASLNPNIPDSSSLKWGDVFKNVSISGDNDIPLDKRGSGVRRLILLNFFRAEVERKRDLDNHPDVIYALEEPETSQHIDHQKKMIDALKSLSNNNHCQILLTTHSSFIVKQLDFDNIRLITTTNGKKLINNLPKMNLPYPSLNEINYIAFNDASIEYHNELYGFLYSKAIENCSENTKQDRFDKWLNSKGCLLNKSWNNNKGKTYNVTLHTYIRNKIHHPENTCNSDFTDSDIKESIEEMRSIITKII